MPDFDLGWEALVTILTNQLKNAQLAPDAAIQFAKLDALPSAQILIGSAGNIATALAMSGDATLSNLGVLTLSPITTSKIAANDPLLNKLADYFIRKIGSNYQAVNCHTTTIDSSNTDFTVVLQYCLNQLVSTGGKVVLDHGTFVMQTQLLPPNPKPFTITIEGASMQSTVLLWGGSAQASSYMIDIVASGTDRKWYYFNNLQIDGSTTTATLGLRAKGGSLASGLATLVYFNNVRIKGCLTPALDLDFIQQGGGTNLYLNTNVTYPALWIHNQSHFTVNGFSQIEATLLSNSNYKQYGGELQYFEISDLTNYTCLINGVAIDPVPAGVATKYNFVLGSVSTTRNVIIDGCFFLDDGSGATGTPTGYISLDHCQDCEIRKCTYPATSVGTVPSIYWNLTANSLDTKIVIPRALGIGGQGKLNNPAGNNTNRTTVFYGDAYLGIIPSIQDNALVFGMNWFDQATGNSINLGNSPSNRNNISIDLATSFTQAQFFVRSRNASNVQTRRMAIGNSTDTVAFDITQCYVDIVIPSTGTNTVPPDAILQIVGDTNRFNYYNDTYGSIPGLICRRADGTLASPTAVQSGEELAKLSARPYDGSAFSASSVGRFAIFAAENFTTSHYGSYASIFTTKKLSTTLSEVARFNDDGTWQIWNPVFTFAYTITPAAIGGATALTLPSSAGTLALVADIAVKGNLPATTVYTDQLNTYTAGKKQTFASDATNAGMAFGGVSADPSSLVANDLFYRSDLKKLSYYDGSATRRVVEETLAQTLTNKTLTAPIITTISNSGTVTIPTGTVTLATTAQLTDGTTITGLVNAQIASGAAIAISKLAGYPADATKSLKGDGTWVADVGQSLTNAHIYVGNVSNIPTDVAMSGDITIDNTGLTAIGAGKVTNTMLAGSIAYSKLSLTGAILNADLAGSIAYSKLVLTTSILDGDISASAAIAKSKISTSGTWVKADLPATTVFTDQANTYTAGTKQSFVPNTTTAGINLGTFAGDPSALSDADAWVNTSGTSVMKVRLAGTTRSVLFANLVATIANKTIDNSNTFSGNTVLTAIADVAAGVGKLWLSSTNADLLKHSNATILFNIVDNVTGRATAQTAANANILTYTVPAQDSSYHISANVLVTTSTTHSFTVTVDYTDEGNTARTVTIGFMQLTGSTILTAITNITGAGPYEGIGFQIRCKANSSIVFKTAAGGTYTTVTYNVEGHVTRLS